MATTPTRAPATNLVSLPRDGRPSKRASIVEAARAVFGRDGFARASIDEIAREAEVSNRTIYNHFAGKEELFGVVVTESAEAVSDAFVGAAGNVQRSADPAEELHRLGTAFAGQRRAFPEHFALTARLRGEEGHFPDAVIDAWQDAGPRRVHAVVAARLLDLADRGLLRLTDPDRAAAHFGALVTAGLPASTTASRAHSPDDINDAVTAGVDAFLNGYASLRDGS